MGSFRLITLTAGFISIVISIFEGIYPSEKYCKQIKLIFSLIFVLCIVSPFVDGKINLPEIESAISSGSEDVESGENAAMDYFKRSIENNISRSIAQQLEENEIFCTEIKTSINISDSGGISINEIEIAADNVALEGEIIALVKDYIGEDTPIKFKESALYDS